MEQWTSIQDLINLSGKTALVTGGAAGIGFGIAKRLHEAGANLVIVDLHHDNAHQAADSLNETRGDSAIAVHADVTHEEDVHRAVDAANDRFGGIDILVNNAGIFPVKQLADMNSADFMHVVQTNLLSVFLFTKRVSDDMKRMQKKGKIINITSIDAIHPSMVGLAHYDASKHGAWGFTKNVARELAEFGITVNALAPGGVATPGVAAMQPQNPDSDPNEIASMQAAFLARIPLHRMADPDEMGRAALFLASDLSSYMTGSHLVVDGGALLM